MTRRKLACGAALIGAFILILTAIISNRGAAPETTAATRLIARPFDVSHWTSLGMSDELAQERVRDAHDLLLRCVIVDSGGGLYVVQPDDEVNAVRDDLLSSGLFEFIDYDVVVEPQS